MEMTKEKFAHTVKRIDNQKVMISIPDEIGGWWGLMAEDVMDMLKGKDITEVIVPISSFGGDVYEAFQIYNILKSYPATVSVYLYSKCMSAGTIIACAADRVYAVPQTVYMIHKALSCNSYENADDKRKSAQLLDITDDMIAATLSKKSGMPRADVLDLMAVESYFTAEQAVQLGFIDELVDTIPFDFQLPNSDEFVKVEENQNDGWSYGWLWDSVKPNVQNSERYRIFNSADLPRYTQKRKSNEVKPHKINNKKDGKMKFENIWNVVKAFISPDKQEAAKAAIEQEGESIVNSISNNVIASIKDSFAKKEDLKVLDTATLKGVILNASPEDKGEILNMLGYQAPKDFDPNTLPKVSDSQEFIDMKAELDDIKAKIANGINIKTQNPTNGGGLPPKGGDKEMSERGKASKAMLDSMLQNGQIAKDVYDAQVAKLM